MEEAIVCEHLLGDFNFLPLECSTERLQQSLLRQDTDAARKARRNYRVASRIGLNSSNLFRRGATSNFFNEPALLNFLQNTRVQHPKTFRRLPFCFWIVCSYQGHRKS